MVKEEQKSDKDEALRQLNKNTEGEEDRVR